jgi:hypothetical protein
VLPSAASGILKQRRAVTVMGATVATQASAVVDGVSARTRWLCRGLGAAILVATAPTLLVDGALHGTPVMNGSARGTALTMLVVALPASLAGLLASSRGSVRGRAVLIGSVAYVTYNAMLFVYATPFNQFFLAYVALLGLALWSLVSSLLDPLPVVEPTGRMPVQGIATFIFAVVGLNAAGWLMFIVPDLGEDPPGFLAGTGLTTNPIYVQDLAVWLPALTIIAVLAWRRRPVGVFLCGAGLVFWLIEALGVAVDQWYGHQAAPSSTVATLGGAVMFVVLACVTAVPLTLWLRAIAGPDAATDPAPR